MEGVGEDTWDANHWMRILAHLISISRRAEAAHQAARVNVCPQQCNYLVRKFGELVEHLRHLDFNSQLIHCKQAVAEIAYLMSKGWHLIDSCTSSDWIWNAVLKEEHKMGFQDVLHDLHTSISCINRILSPPGAVPAIATIGWAEERAMLDQTADADRAHLTQMVQRAWETRPRAFGCLRRSRSPLMKFLHELLANPRLSLSDEVVLPDRHIHLFLNPADLEEGRLIGYGAYGSVHEATWLGKTVAMKAYGRDDRILMRELAALIFLRHPNIVRMIGYTRKSSTSPYSLVMERMERDLHHLIRDIVDNVEEQRDSPFTLDVALDIILQIAKGMEFLHSRDVIHLDLNTANILVKLPKYTSPKFFTVKISDFGLAGTKFMSAATTQQMRQAGTIIYMAPEVWHGGTTYTRTADVYSFAMTCYEVLVGKTPFEGYSGPPAAFIGMVTQNNLRPALPAGFPDYLTEFLQRCWHGNPAIRPSFTEICNYLTLRKNERSDDVGYHDAAIAALEYTRTLMQNAPPHFPARDARMKYGEEAHQVIQSIRTLRDSYNQLEAALPGLADDGGEIRQVAN